MEEVAAAFPGDVVVSYGGSGQIARQVSLGAPADIVVLANAAILVGVFLVAGSGRAAWPALLAGLAASGVNGVWLVINRYCLSSGEIHAWELFFLQAIVSGVVFLGLGWRDDIPCHAGLGYQEDHENVQSRGRFAWRS